MDNTRESSTQAQSKQMLKFVIQHGKDITIGPRVGQLNLRGQTIKTPSYIAATSRGVIPHLTQDVLQKHVTIPAVYFGLEDFIEKSTRNAPIFNTPPHPGLSPLQAFVGLSEKHVSILGPRRLPSVVSAQQTTNSSIGISTSVGFSNLSADDYQYATQRLQPDLSVGFADVVKTEGTSKKRLLKSADRTHAWLRDTLAGSEDICTGNSLLASIPPIEAEQQSFYLSDLGEEYYERLAGLCIYLATTTAAIPNALSRLVRISLSELKTPHDVLYAVSMGVDLIAISFINSTSEAGIAMFFSLNPVESVGTNETEQLPLGIDMWSPDHASDTGPLTPGCECYTCTRHHRAYIEHLLQAREMLAWTLLQIHNFHIMTKFFEQIRDSITNGKFEDDCQRFKRMYAPEMPLQTGEGPRVRGYQTKSIGRGEAKKNPKAYGRLEEQARKIEEAESGIATPTPDEDSNVLEAHGLGQKLE